MSEYTTNVENTPDDKNANLTTNNQNENNNSAESDNQVHPKSFEDFEKEELERQALLEQGIDNSGKKRVKTADGNIFIAVDDITDAKKIYKRNGFSMKSPELYSVEKPTVTEMPDEYFTGSSKADIFTGFEKFIRRNPLSTSTNLVYRKNKIKISQNKKLLMRKYREERRLRIKKAGEMKVSITVLIGLISCLLVFYPLNYNSLTAFNNLAYLIFGVTILLIFRSKITKYACIGCYLSTEIILVIFGFIPYLRDFGFNDNLFVSISYILTFVLLPLGAAILFLSSDAKSYFEYIAQKKR